jgi:hypothetical protein
MDGMAPHITEEKESEQCYASRKKSWPQSFEKDVSYSGKLLVEGGKIANSDR